MTTTDATIVNGTADEIGHELTVVNQPTGLFRTDDPVEVVEKAARVADALKDVIVRKGLFTLIQGKAHIGVEGWQLVGAMLGVTAVCVHTEPVDGGYLATVEARTSDGRVIGRADAVCTKHEQRGPWKKADDYARLSMAQTRATSKALKGPLGFVVSLAGYATTPAEEMTFVEPDAPTPQAPPPAMSADPVKATTRAATAKQRGLINAKAADAGLTPVQLANVLLAATGQEPREFDSDAHAKDSCARWMDRLPASSVDTVLDAITTTAAS